MRGDNESRIGIAEPIGMKSWELQLVKISIYWSNVSGEMIRRDMIQEEKTRYRMIRKYTIRYKKMLYDRIRSD